MEITANPSRVLPFESRLASITRTVRPRVPDWCVLFHKWCKAHGSFPKIFRPVTFNEKVLFRNLFDRRAVLAQLTDKAALRSYVEQCLNPEVLPRLYCLTDRPETIPFDDLPDRFVVKPTHGSGWVQLVTEKSTIDRAALVRRCSDWLKRSYYEASREWVYKHIRPRIIVEELIGDGSGAAPDDYKLYVFDGKVQLIHVDRGRFSDHRRRLFTPAWERVSALSKYQDIVGDVPKPAHLADMIAAAETLGRDLDFVRADFYELGDRFLFGELAMIPGGGCDPFYPKEYDGSLGKLWELRYQRGRHSNPLAVGKSATSRDFADGQ